MTRSRIVLTATVLGAALLLPSLPVRGEDTMKPMGTMDMGHPAKKPMAKKTHKKAMEKKPAPPKSMEMK